VADAGHEHGVVEMLVDDVAAAIDQHGGDGAGIAGQHGANARIDRIAQILDEGIGALPNILRCRRRDDFYGAADETRGADALEEHIPREIVRAGFERLHRRIEHRLDFDVGTGVRRHAALHREPHALRLLVHAAAFHVIDAQHEAVGVLALFAQLDIAADGHAGGRITQYRMGDERSLDGRHGEAKSHRGKAERDDEGDDLPPATPPRRPRR
jgi:hypothetical protein